MKRDKPQNVCVEQTRIRVGGFVNKQERVGKDFLIKDGQSDKSGTISLPLHRQKMITLKLSPFLSLRSRKSKV